VAELRVWDNGNDWVIAESAEEAFAEMEKHIGDGLDPEEHKAFEPCEPADVHRYWINERGDGIAEEGDDGADVVRLTNAEACAKFGKGYLGSRDY